MYRMFDRCKVSSVPQNDTSRWCRVSSGYVPYKTENHLQRLVHFVHSSVCCNFVSEPVMLLEFIFNFVECVTVSKKISNFVCVSKYLPEVVCETAATYPVSTSILWICYFISMLPKFSEEYMHKVVHVH